MAILLFGIVGCSSSVRYQYDIDPTPLKKGSTQYWVNSDDIQFHLVIGHGGDPSDKSFASEKEMTATFIDALKAKLASLHQLSPTKENADARVIVNANWVRKYNWGGKALNKPVISYQVIIMTPDSQKTLSHYTINNVTTEYSYFKELAVGAQISTFQRGPEDEPEDIQLMAKVVGREISRMGK